MEAVKRLMRLLTNSAAFFYNMHMILSEAKETQKLFPEFLLHNKCTGTISYISNTKKFVIGHKYNRSHGEAQQDK